MDLHVNTCPISMLSTLFDQTAEAPFDLDVHLPEYCPDIQRVLQCTVRPNIRTVAVSGESVQIEGNGVLRMLYATEDHKISVYEQSVPIRKSLRSPVDLSRAAVRADARTDFVNCRASGQRRADVHGMISLRVCAFGREEQTLVCGDDSGLLQTKTERVTALSLTGLGERVFAMSEVVELGEDEPAVDKILRAQAALRVDSTKAVKDKLLVKGEAVVEWMYLPLDGDVPLRTRHTMPISQILETAGVSEDDIQDVTLSVQELLLTPKTDGNGEFRLVEAALRVRASVRTVVPVQTDAVTDVYATEGDLRTTWFDKPFLSAAETFRDSISVRQSVELPGGKAARILDVRFGDVTAAYSGEGDLIAADCSASIGVLYLDEDGEPFYTESTIQFPYSRRLTQPYAQSTCEVQVQILSCKGSAAGSGAELQMDVLIGGTVYAVCTRRLLQDAQLQPSQGTQTPAAMTIYFADSGESVWDIARFYRTTTQAVLLENDLTEDILPEKRMLVIPGN